MIEAYPMRLAPCYKEYLWGGDRLRREFGKADAPEVTAESWELACHPDGMSTVAQGPYAGMNLAQLAALDRAAFWGRRCAGERFPLMVKLIDAKRSLSVQVHPSEESARAGEQAKAEMWYVVDCEPQASLLLGFSRAITRSEFLARARDGTICEALNRVPIQRGDVFYVLPGTVHAIGAGMLLAEIQQNANTTFRIDDFGRRGADGKPRPLHIERAADVADYRPIVPQECRANSCAAFPGLTMTQMFACRHFAAYRLDVRGRAALRCDGERFSHLLCVEGAGGILSGGRAYPLSRGSSYFMPAALGEYEIEGACRLLLSTI